MMTSMLRQRNGTKVMPVSANTGYSPRFTRRPNRLSGIGAALLSRPGPNGGTEIVDANGDTIYTEDQVAANPSLLSSLAASSPCPGGLLPTWFPGGESVCADPSAIVPGEGNSPFAQFNYAIGGSCTVDGWCLTGSDATNPASYVWQGGGTPTTLNPAIVMGAQPLPTVFNTALTPAQEAAAQQAIGSGNPQGAIQALTNTPTPVVTPTTSTVLNPPRAAGPATGVTAQSIANGSPQAGNTSMNVGAGSDNALTDLETQAETATGLSGTTLLLIAAGVAALLVLKK